MSPLHEYEYTVDEFLSHFYSIEGTRIIEKEVFYRVNKKFSQGYTIQEYLAQTLEYMQLHYDDEDEALYKTGYYAMIMWHIINNIDKYNKNDYAIVGSKESGSLISVHLLKAVHKVVMEENIDDENEEYDVEFIMRMADKYKEEE